MQSTGRRVSTRMRKHPIRWSRQSLQRKGMVMAFTCAIYSTFVTRWKLCWTRRSHIDDMGWVRSSFEMQNELIKRRRGVRVEKTAPIRAARRKAMMVVTKIDGWIRVFIWGGYEDERGKPTACVHNLQLLLTLPMTVVGAGKRIAHMLKGPSCSTKTLLIRASTTGQQLYDESPTCLHISLCACPHEPLSCRFQ